jgi:glycosidase
LVERRNHPRTTEFSIYQGLKRLIRMRQENGAFSGRELRVIDTGNPQVLGFVRIYQNQRALVFANFSEQEQRIPGNLLRLYGLGYALRDLLSGEEIPLGDIHLEPCGVACLGT